MKKTNFILYSLLSVQFFATTARAMEENSREDRSHTVSLSVKNATAKNDYECDPFSNFRFRVDFARAENLVKGCKPACFNNSKRLVVPSQKEGVSFETQDKLGSDKTKRITIYGYGDLNLNRALPLLLDPVELNLGWPVKLTAVHIDFYGVKRESIDGIQHFIPDLSVQVNDYPYDILVPQNFVCVNTGKRFSYSESSFTQETEPKKMIVSVQNDTGKNYYEFQETLNALYRDLRIEVVLDKATNLRRFTRGEEEGLKLHPIHGCSLMEERVNPSRREAENIAAYVFGIKTDLNSSDVTRCLFGIYQLELPVSTLINDVRVIVGAKKLISKKGEFIPELSFQINGQKDKLKPKKFFREGIEYQIN